MKVRFGNRDVIHDILVNPHLKSEEDRALSNPDRPVSVGYDPAPLPSPMDFVGGVFNRIGSFYSIEGLVCAKKEDSFGGLSDRFGAKLEGIRSETDSTDFIWRPTQRNGEGYVLKKDSSGNYVPIFSVISLHSDKIRRFCYGSHGSGFVSFFKRDQAISFEDFNLDASLFEKYFNLFVDCCLFNGRSSQEKKKAYDFPICLSI